MYNDMDDEEGGMEESAGAKPQEGKEDEERHTAVINSDICPECKPGDLIQLRIEEVHDKEYVVSYEPQEEKKPEGEETEAPEPQGDSRFASMMD